MFSLEFPFSKIDKDARRPCLSERERDIESFTHHSVCRERKMKPLVTKCSGSKTRPERLRTCSSDSGCEVQCEGLVDIQEDSIPHSTIRSDITDQARDSLSLRHCQVSLLSWLRS